MITKRVILLGLGGVGRSLLRQILDHRGFHRVRWNLRLEIAALCDSSSLLAGNLNEAALEEAHRIKSEGGSLDQHRLGSQESSPSSLAIRESDAESVVVDCTDSLETASALLQGLERGAGVVLANKRPLTSAWELFAELTRPRGGRCLGRARWEATVASGVPAIATLNRLVASGDRIDLIRGATSGTLGRLMTGLQKGMSFSRILLKAHREGATESDPRDDLSGTDVARKALILARGMGQRLDLDQVSVESLFPDEMRELPLDRFLASLESLDRPLRQRVDSMPPDRLLRYASRIEPAGCRVGLEEVGAETPMGRLQGPDNLLEFHSRWYRTTPLVLQGRGEGVHATAAGVLSDILDLC